MAESTAKKEKTKGKAQEPKDELGEEIEALEGFTLDEVPISVPRELTHPDTEEVKIFVQHEMPWVVKLKFFRLLSGTIRLASENENGTVSDFLSDVINPVQTLMQQGYTKEQAEQLAANSFIETIMRLIELIPDFAEELYLYALNVRPVDQEWARQSLVSLDDEEGIDILDTFIAQNGKSIKDFFAKRLGKIGARIAQVADLEDTEQESESTD
jgi:hypothetical protein